MSTVTDTEMMNPLHEMDLEEDFSDWLKLSRQLEEKGELRKSRDSYLVALETPLNTAQENYEIYEGLGRIKTQMGMIYEALYAFERAKVFSHRYCNNWDDLKEVFEGSDSSPRALIDAFKLDKNNPTTWTTIGISMFYEDKIALAEYCFQKAVKLDEDDCNAWRELHAVYKKTGESVKSLQAFKKVRDRYNTYG